mmetsp:Transcript_41353/g.63008  ORF Transcript_41353/g.63008 Transcript_41353/m.63008 type:complete len:163 (+) Transcript_41353:946-1434(+)
MTARKFKVWEEEIRDLQDKSQAKQFTINKLEAALTKVEKDKTSAYLEKEKIEKEVHLLYSSLQTVGTGHSLYEKQIQSCFGKSTDVTFALASLKSLINENEQLKDELNDILSTTIRNYYELSKLSHKACDLQLKKIRKKEMPLSSPAVGRRSEEDLLEIKIN